MQDTSALWESFQATRDKDIKDDLVRAYLPLVRNIALSILRKLRQGAELDDLMSDGTFGLMRAIEAFDRGRGVKFETYATPVIRGSIYNGMRALDWVPERTRSKARMLQKVMEKISMGLGRPATEQEIADELRMSSQEVYDLINDLGCVYLLSLDQPLSAGGEEDEATIMDMVTDRASHDPSSEYEFHEQRNILRTAIDTLDPREQFLIKKHYFEGVSFESTAEMLGVSKQRVSQMHSRAVRRLRERLNGQEISPEAMLEFTVDPVTEIPASPGRPGARQDPREADADLPSSL
jgi:RNA polymerase sigma factor for flagellar operon FliA